MLSLISHTVNEHIESINSLKPVTNTHEYTYFVKAGASNSQKQKTKKDNMSHLLSNGNDWKLTYQTQITYFHLKSTAQMSDLTFAYGLQN